MMSLPLAKITNPNTMMRPIVSATSINLSEGLRLVMISTNRNRMWPPSRAGMGRMFITARAMDRKAVMRQKRLQIHVSGKMLPMEMKPPTLSYALVFGLKMSLTCFQ